MRRWLLVIGVMVVLAAVGVWWYTRPAPPQYVTTPAVNGDVVRSIVATGSLNPVVTVEVGTYVSGVIQKLYCDYNTQVKAGQLCAKIDPRPFQVAVDQARGNLLSAEAQLTKDRAGLSYARVNYQRDLGLLARGIVSQDTIDSDKSAYEQAQAQVKLDEATIVQRKAALEAANVNLAYTDIVSPVNGVVVSRSVSVGQTVAASFQTPTLFLIAQDMTKMQVDTNVSESDIGGVKVGQRAYFTVAAYPGKTFEGQVAQVREAPIEVQNVVTYDAVISVANPERQLLPGMTANVRIVTDERHGVLRIPAQALQFAPKGVASANGANSRGSQPAGSHVWVLRQGRPVRVPVTVGLSDGTNVEIVAGQLQAGDPVVVGEITGGGQSRRRSPFGLR